MNFELDKFRTKILYRVLWDQCALLLIFSLIIFFTYDQYTFEKREESLYQKIINCIYFSSVTQFSIGYGNIVPITDSAKIVNVIHHALSYFLMAIEISYMVKIK